MIVDRIGTAAFARGPVLSPSPRALALFAETEKLELASVSVLLKKAENSPVHFCAQMYDTLQGHHADPFYH